MRKIGFIISEKENEKRRALVLDDIKNMKNRKYLYFQEGYGRVLGFSDEDIIEAGANVSKKEKILSNCDVICEPKIGDSNDLKNIKNKIIFGWIHATQNYDITQICIDNKLTVYAWEKMFYKGKHVFYKNNQLAGETAILHAMLMYGRNFENLNAAVLGRGNTAMGAIKILNKLGANIQVYSRNEEQLFREELNKYNIIVNCVLWDTSRKDHIIMKEDLSRLKNDAIIIDISCDKNGAIESSVPTTIDEPIYYEKNVMHYVVDHTPTLFYKDASISLSKEISFYIDFLIEEKDNTVLDNALIIEDGKVIDKEIIEYQKR